MKLWCSVIASSLLSLAASSARADIAPDPCTMMGSVEGADCTTFSGKPGKCAASPSGGSLFCMETSASGGGGGGGGAGGAGGSGEGGSGGSGIPDRAPDDDQSCSLRAVGSAGAAGGAAVVMMAAGALLLRKRRR